MSQTVRIIPPTINRKTAQPAASKVKRKVAGYARVSTDEIEQQTSYEAQVDYYTNYIKGRDDWEFVKVYTDEGITGTSTKLRKGFQQMVADALDGKIDLIVTKSVSRFARNTVDSLTTIRRLKENGTEVYFEKENIWTFDSKGELLLTIMSSLAQEESRSISENIRWGTRKKFADGRYSMNYKNFLGYDKGPDGTLVINEEQAKTVRKIYGLYLAGYTSQRIATILTEEKIPTPARKKKWSVSTVNGVLSNETYMGDKLLQKTYSVDFLHKKRLTNTGQVQQYYVEGDHEPIIPPETFQRVQDEIERRKNRPASGSTIFSGRIFCPQCGTIYGHKTWHSTSKTFRKEVWQCNGKYVYSKRHPPRTWWDLIQVSQDDTGKKCTSPTLQEEDFRDAFEQVLHRLDRHKPEIISNLNEVLQCVANTKIELEDALARMEQERKSLSDFAYIETGGAMTPERIQRAEETMERCKQLDEEINHTEKKLWQARTRRYDILDFITRFEGMKEPEFSEELWCFMVDYVLVYEDRFQFTLTSGEKVSVGF